MWEHDDTRSEFERALSEYFRDNDEASEAATFRAGFLAALEQARRNTATCADNKPGDTCHRTSVELSTIDSLREQAERVG